MPTPRDLFIGYENIQKLFDVVEQLRDLKGALGTDEPILIDRATGLPLGGFTRNSATIVRASNPTEAVKLNGDESVREELAQLTLNMRRGRYSPLDLAVMERRAQKFNEVLDDLNKVTHVDQYELEEITSTMHRRSKLN